MRSVVALVVGLVVVVVFAACVFPPVGVGAVCNNGADCTGSGTACFRIDETDDASEKICVPLVAQEETLCNEDVECAAAGWPVDATCNGGACHCLRDNFTCGFDEELDEDTCVCGPKPSG